MSEEPVTEAAPAQYLLLLAAVLLLTLLAWLLAPILTPFVGGMLLAYMGDPIVDRLQARGIGRIYGVLLVFFLLLLLLAVTLLVTLPLLGREIAAFIKQLPVLLTWLQEVSLPWLERLGLDPAQLNLPQLQEVLLANWQDLGAYTTKVLAEVTKSGFALLAFVANLVLLPVVAFYILKDWDRFTGQLHHLLPVSLQPRALRLAKECDEVLSAFLRGQLLIMICLGAFYSLGLSWLGLESALLIGILSGIFAIVPFLGTAVGVGSASLAAIFQSGDLMSLLLLVWALYLVGQILEGYVLTPLLVGDRIGLHPVAVIFSVLAGGQLFGMTGVLLALPVAAMIMVFLRHIHEVYKGSSLYVAAGEKTAFKPPDPDLPGQ